MFLALKLLKWLILLRNIILCELLMLKERFWFSLAFHLDMVNIGMIILWTKHVILSLIRFLSLIRLKLVQYVLLIRNFCLQWLNIILHLYSFLHLSISCDPVFSGFFFLIFFLFLKTSQALCYVVVVFLIFRNKWLLFFFIIKVTLRFHRI